MNTEKNEKILLSIISETSKLNENLAKKYLPKTNKLFESIFYQEEKSIPENLSLSECRGNKYFLFESVKEYLQNLRYGIDKESIRIINENYNPEFNSNFDIINNFVKDLDKEIEKLKSINQIQSLQALSKDILKTKFFSKAPILINGFDIQSIINPNSPISKEVSEKHGIRLLADTLSVIYNDSDKEIYFVVLVNNRIDVIYYSIVTNTLDKLWNTDFYERFGTNRDNFFSKLDTLRNNKFKPSDIMKIFGEYINNNIFNIHNNLEKFKGFEFKDNLYGDYSYQERLNIVKFNNNSLIKK